MNRVFLHPTKSYVRATCSYTSTLRSALRLLAQWGSDTGSVRPNHLATLYRELAMLMRIAWE